MSELQKGTHSGMFGILVSRFTGFLREMAFTWFFGGTGVMQAAYLLAIRIPNIFRDLLGEGALSQAVTPAISALLAKGEREKAWEVARRIFSWQLRVLLFLLLLGWGAVACCYHFWGNSSQASIRYGLAVLPILLPILLFACATAFFFSILNCLGKFFLSFSLQAVLNLVEAVGLVGMFFLGFRQGEFRSLVLYSAIGTFGCFLQLVVAGYFCHRSGFHLFPRRRETNGDLPEFFRNFGGKFFYSFLGAGVHQINVFVDTCFLGGYVAASGISAHYFCNRLILIVIALCGTATATSSLTELSRLFATGKREVACGRMEESLRLTFFMAVPGCILLAMLAEPVIQLLFQHGNYSPEATRVCVATMAFAVWSLPILCLQKVLVVPYHAQNDTKTPAIISMVCVAVNALLNALLVQRMQQRGLVLATGVSSCLNCLILTGFLHRKMPEWRPVRFLWYFLKLVPGAVATVLICLGIRCALVRLLPEGQTMFSAMLQLAAGGLGGVAAYLLLGKCLGISETDFVLQTFQRRLFRSARSSR